jgi:outer membrane protein OmpA-like peptidoglycan-associated protein
MARILRLVPVLAALFALFVLAGAPARADEVQGRLGLQIQSLTSGDELPALVLNPTEDVKSISVKLKRGDGKQQTLSAQNVASGGKKVLKIQQEAGSFQYDAHMDIKWGGGESSSYDMQFSATRVQKLKLDLKPENVDLDAHVMTFSINNPAKKATLEIIGQDKKRITLLTVDFNNASSGSELKVTWDTKTDDVLYMDLKVYDVADFWTGVRLTPIFINIPHDEVEFEFGKWAIRKSEEPKLEATMAKIKEALDKHGTLLTLKLFIAGYTDTVGSKESNKTLSNNRARSIASWFRSHGLKIPISFQGFGEEVLAVKTPDETPEPKNRRAIYILATQQPAAAGVTPKSDWKPIN